MLRAPTALAVLLALAAPAASPAEQVEWTETPFMRIKSILAEDGRLLYRERWWKHSGARVEAPLDRRPGRSSPLEVAPEGLGAPWSPAAAPRPWTAPSDGARAMDRRPTRASTGPTRGQARFLQRGAKVFLARGSRVRIALEAPLDGAKARPGDRIRFRVLDDLSYQGNLVLEAGTRGMAHVAKPWRGGLHGVMNASGLRLGEVPTLGEARIPLQLDRGSEEAGEADRRGGDEAVHPNMQLVGGVFVQGRAPFHHRESIAWASVARDTVLDL